MKIYKFMIAAFAATMALTSCTKDSVDMNGANTQPDGTRVITVSFNNTTRTYLDRDGLTPRFEEGDMILVSNGTTTKILPIYVDDKGVPTFSTILTGELTAVYPASAAVVENNVIKGVKVPAEQSGRFADANIAIAEHITDNHAYFRNATAILKFYVHYSVGVERLVIESASENIATGSKTISVGADKDMLSDNVEDETLCYVAVLPGEIQKLDITSYAPTQTESDGIVKKTYENIKIKAGQMASVFMPYYVQIGTQKWAYCNLGAFLPEEPGYYYSWGDSKGHFLNGNWEDYYFTPEAYPASDLTTNIDPMSNYDAAHVALGGKWRMPTPEECKVLTGLNPSLDEVNSKKVWRFSDDMNTLYLPVTGYYEKDQRSDIANNQGCYWTSTIFSGKDSKKAGATEHGNAIAFTISSNDYSPVFDNPQYSRFKGLSIRPFFDESKEVDIDPYKQGPNL